MMWKRVVVGLWEAPGDGAAQQAVNQRKHSTAARGSPSATRCRRLRAQPVQLLPICNSKSALSPARARGDLFRKVFLNEGSQPLLGGTGAGIGTGRTRSR